MLSNSESVKMTNFIYSENDILNKLKEYEKQYNMNSIEAYYSDKKDDDFTNWKELFISYLYSNSNIFSINKYEKLTYLTIPKELFLRNIVSYLDIVSLYIKKNPNVVMVITNGVSEYKRIIELCNERRILCMLVSDNIEDKYLDYTNLFVQISKTPSKDAKKFKLKALKTSLVIN